MGNGGVTRHVGTSFLVSHAHGSRYPYLFRIPYLNVSPLLLPLSSRSRGGGTYIPASV